MTTRMILLSTNHPRLRFPSKEVFRALKIVYKEEGKEIPALAVVCTHNRFIRKMNKEFLEHDYITDVIAFPLGNDGGVEAEIYVNLDAARNQAKKYNVTYTQEARRLLIHGALHLLGYDDKTQGKKNMMNAREEFYLGLMSRKARL
ncbi:MAG: rRNA maturation RNase YbeY [Ignavibacteriales bacterium]|nr:rRNA maturation RNase YbeY [Ignavibacteriales bacterium]